MTNRRKINLYQRMQALPSSEDYNLNMKIVNDPGLPKTLWGKLAYVAAILWLLVISFKWAFILFTVLGISILGSRVANQRPHIWGFLALAGVIFTILIVFVFYVLYPAIYNSLKRRPK